MSLFGKHDKDDEAAGQRSGRADDLVQPGGSPHDDDDAGSARVDTGRRGDTGGRGDTGLTLSEERVAVGTETVDAGSVRARKHVDTEHVSQVVPRGVEHADMERAPASEGDSGQVETLPDGSISIPVFEEQIVVEKRLVVRERVILRKHTVYEEHEVTADLRRERLEVETDGDVRVTEEGPRREG